VKLLVDTQAFIWYAKADEQLPDAIRSVMRSPDNELWLSAASGWEIAIKHHAGKLTLAVPAWQFIVDARERLGFLQLPIDENSVAHLPKLPAIHKDPFDRILMCQSIEHGLMIVTSDANIRKYPVRTLWLE
jgi:PIN domain nuclease of toxin-antitoxin system